MKAVLALLALDWTSEKCYHTHSLIWDDSIIPEVNRSRWWNTLAGCYYLI